MHFDEPWRVDVLFWRLDIYGGSFNALNQWEDIPSSCFHFHRYCMFYMSLMVTYHRDFGRFEQDS